MNDRAYANVQVQQKTLIGSSAKSSLLQRTCACGQHTIAGSECSTCQNERLSLGRTQRALGALSASVPAQENVPFMNSGSSGSSRFGHNFSQIPVHTSHPSVLQTKLVVNRPGDVYEQEADQVAEQVMRMADPQISVSDDEDETKNSLMRKESGVQGANGATDTSDVPPIVHDVLNSGGGQPLDATTRSFMEPRFGHDFSQVRVHTDERAAESARSVNALAYTVGRDVVFGTGHYAPETIEGRRLMAHELTHVLQQKYNYTALARKDLQDKSSRSTEGETSSYKPEENVPRGSVELVTSEPHYLSYRVYGFDIGSFDVRKPGIKEGLDSIIKELEEVNIMQMTITGFASESRLKGRSAYVYGLERAEAVSRYLAGSKVIHSITTRSEGSTFAPPASASPSAKAYARAVTIGMRYTGPQPVVDFPVVLEPHRGPLDLSKIKQEVEGKLTQDARERGQLRSFKQSDLTGYTYRYDHIIGRERHSGLVDDRLAVLWALQANPNDFFPFDVKGRSGEKDIILGGEYDLVNKSNRLLPLPPGRHPIRVTSVTDHSFTFTTLEGHFDTPGSTITFTIYEDTNGIIHIEHYGVAIPSKEPSSTYLFAPDAASFAWDEQATNLSKWLETVDQHQLIIPHNLNYSVTFHLNK